MSKPKQNANTPTEVTVELTPEQLAAKELAEKQEADAKALAEAKLQEEAEATRKQQEQEELLRKEKEEADALAALKAQNEAAAKELAKTDAKSSVVEAVEHEIKVYMELHDTANISLADRVKRHTALLRLTENVIKLPKPDDFVGAMDAFLRAIKTSRGVNEAFSAGVINRYASEVNANTASIHAYQFFINALTIVAEHLDAESQTSFSVDLDHTLFEKYYPGLPGERFLNYCIRLCS